VTLQQLAACGALALTLSACGRVRYVHTGSPDAGRDARDPTPLLDASLGVDASADVGLDAPRDVGLDAPRDVGLDAPRDAGRDGGTDTNAPARLWTTLSPIGYYPFDGDGRDLADPTKSIACSGCTYPAGARMQGLVTTAPVVVPARPGTGDFAFALWVFVPPVVASSNPFKTNQTRVEADYSAMFLRAYVTVSAESAGGGGPSCDPDTWQHVAVNYVNATRTYSVFYNGTLDRTLMADVDDSLTGMLLNEVPGPASIDELFLFDRILTQSEIDLLQTRP
jgi:hypothetical protein